MSPLYLLTEQKLPCTGAKMGNVLRLSNVKKTIRYMKRNGLKAAYYAAKERAESADKNNYCYCGPTKEECLRQKEAGNAFSVRFSILVPLFETAPDFLCAMIDSVLAQTYGNFELILADGGNKPIPSELLTPYTDERIRYRRLSPGGGISANTNQALMYATGDYACLLDHDDLLTVDALFEMAAAIEAAKNHGEEVLMLYSDEDKYDGNNNTYYDYHRKSDFNLDLILSNNYICHFLVMKRQLMQELQLNGSCDGAQDYDLVLRAVSHMFGRNKRPEKAEKLPIVHISKVLYHWRSHEASTADNPESKRYAYEAGKRAIESFLRLREWKGTVLPLKHLGFYRVAYEPDVFHNRTDVGVIGGRILNEKNRIVGGMRDECGHIVYEGLHKEYSGNMHRAVLMQEAYAIDVRCMQVSPACESIMEELTGLPFLKDPENGRFNWRGSLRDDADYERLSRLFCEKCREKSLRILYDPQMTEICKEK